MILLYAFGKDEKADAIRRFLDKKNFPYRDIDQELIHESLGRLLAGEGEARENPEAPAGPAIAFSQDVDHEEAVRLLAAFERIGMFFDYKIHADDHNESLALEDVFRAHKANEQLIEDIRQLQSLIEATAQLDEEDYDPDLWSELKFAVADANDFFASLVQGEVGEADERHLASLKPTAESLRKALGRLVD